MIETEYSGIEARREVFRQGVDSVLKEVVESSASYPTLSDPIRYTLLAPGKRMRPLMTVLAAAMFGKVHSGIYAASAAIEILHNFTLVHDDIMDNAELRRGVASVHARWGVASAILSGDAMLGLAYSLLHERVDPHQATAILPIFTSAFLEVCEGQAMDLDFADRAIVTMDEYMLMIEKKTARLLAAAAAMGATLNGASSAHIASVTEVARLAGIAFQIQDDVLDLMAVEAELGKSIGQDLLEGKKTYLIVAALEDLREEDDRRRIQLLIADHGLAAADVDSFRTMFVRNGIIDRAQNKVDEMFNDAITVLHTFPKSEQRDDLEALLRNLHRRRK